MTAPAPDGRAPTSCCSSLHTRFGTVTEAVTGVADSTFANSVACAATGTKAAATSAAPSVVFMVLLLTGENVMEPR